MVEIVEFIDTVLSRVDDPKAIEMVREKVNTTMKQYHFLPGRTRNNE